MVYHHHHRRRFHHHRHHRHPCNNRRHNLHLPLHYLHYTTELPLELSSFGWHGLFHSPLLHLDVLEPSHHPHHLLHPHQPL